MTNNVSQGMMALKQCMVLSISHLIVHPFPLKFRAKLKMAIHADMFHTEK